MREIADSHGVPVAHVAYAWLLAKSEVSSVIVGASRPGQLVDNLAAAELTLSGEESARLDAIDVPPPVYPDPRWLTSRM